MQTVVWILRFIIVLVLVWFAAKNSDPVKLNGLPGQEWMIPLVFILLVVFIGGGIIGFLAWGPAGGGPRRGIGRLEKGAAAPPPLAAPAPPPPPRGILVLVG